MIGQAVNEKRGNIQGCAINIILFALFLGTIYIILNLIVNMRRISGSEWFSDVLGQASQQNFFIREQVKSLESFIIMYGTAAIIIIILLFVIMAHSYVSKSCRNIRIMHMVGYNLAQIFRYNIKAFLIDFSIAVCIMLIAVNALMDHFFDAAGISDMADDAGVDIGQSFGVALLLMVITVVYMAIVYRVKAAQYIKGRAEED